MRCLQPGLRLLGLRLRFRGIIFTVFRRGIRPLEFLTVKKVTA